MTVLKRAVTTSRGAHAALIWEEPRPRTVVARDEELVMGLDEAGRGAVLGPLVVGGFVARADDVGRLRALGVRDSKLLTPDQREQVYRVLPQVGRSCSTHLAPPLIDSYVRHNALNELEARAFGRLARRAGVRRLFVDACDPVASRFGAAVRRWAGPEVVVDARHHADRDLPIVGAASIVAKVRRDRAIARLAGELLVDPGSGYPSDPTTQACVRTTLSGGGTLPGWLRASWATVARLKPDRVGPTIESFS